MRPQQTKDSAANPWMWYDGLPSKGMGTYVLHFFPWLFHIRFFQKLFIAIFLPHCDGIFFLPGFRVYYGDKLTGKRCFLGNTLIMNYAPVTIGEGANFSLDNKILTGTHGIYDRNWIMAKPVTIGKNVWVSTNCTILGGVTIGENSIIAAGSVVTKNIPANCLAGGNPCRIIKKLKNTRYQGFMYPGDPRIPADKRGSAY